MYSSRINPVSETAENNVPIGLPESLDTSLVLVRELPMLILKILESKTIGVRIAGIPASHRQAL
jgi:hypothetical protein